MGRLHRTVDPDAVHDSICIRQVGEFGNEGGWPSSLRGESESYHTGANPLLQ